MDNKTDQYFFLGSTDGLPESVAKKNDDGKPISEKNTETKIIKKIYEDRGIQM